jgi:hypothetical protein
MTPAGAPWASARTRPSESLRLQSDKRAPLPERFHHPHQTGKLTPKCRPRDFLSEARRNLPRNCLCRLERIRGRENSENSAANFDWASSASRFFPTTVTLDVDP